MGTRKVIWLTGNTGAGKSTAAFGLQKRYPHVIVLDGDEMRATISENEDLSPEGRRRHNLRVARLAKLLSSQGHQVVVAVIAPYADLRQDVSAICDPLWVYVKRTLAADIRKPYEEPTNPHLTIHTDKLSPEESVDLLSKILT